MSGAIAMSGLAAGRLLARGAAATRFSRPQFLRLRAQQPMAARAFSAGLAAQVKKYTEDHEWVEVEGDSATIGISEYAANALGDVVYVELPTVDLEASKGETIGAVESVKSASDILSPISGSITEVNGALEDKPSLINQSPEGEGWLAKVKVSDVAELDSLMDAEAYKQFTVESDSK